MRQDERLAGTTLELPGKVIFVAARPGRERLRLLEEWREKAEQNGARAWVLPCRFTEGGPWAGARNLFRSLLDEIRESRPDLLGKHEYELAHVLPELKPVTEARNANLTDIATPDEKVRNYAGDRAYRIVHGLIDLLSSLKPATDGRPWVILCDSFEESGSIGGRFFRELMRRRGRQFELTLVVATAPDASARIRAEFDERLAGPVLPFDLPEEEPEKVDVEAATQAAMEIERRMQHEGLPVAVGLIDLLHLWRQAGRPERIFRWEVLALDQFNTQGLYEDALAYGSTLLERQEIHAPDDEQLRWAVFVKNLMSLLGLQQILAAQALAEEVAIGKFADPYRRAQLCYLVSMMYARFLPERDLDRAEQLLDEGLEELERADIPPDVLHFQSVFNRNGLALVRFFQGRHAEAIDLCLSGFERLKEHLSPEQHRLHRSVLLYNIAQVYSALGMDDDAIRHYTLAMEMDPNFSEYYNERANLHFRAGRYEEALRDYQMAGELSPPYYELYTNLGQCHRHLGRFEEAAAAYSKALDLEPGQVLALLGRAQCEEALGQAAAALADYDEALALVPGQWEALANRATLHYDRGDLPSALKDMEAAIELAPQVAGLYQNRGFLHSELGMAEEAARDFSTYLSLDPEAADRDEVLARLQDLQALAPGNPGAGQAGAASELAV